MSVNEEKREGGERIQDIFSGLDEVVRGMEKEDVSLEQSFDLYYKAMRREDRQDRKEDGYA